MEYNITWFGRSLDRPHFTLLVKYLRLLGCTKNAVSAAMFTVLSMLDRAGLLKLGAVSERNVRVSTCGCKTAAFCLPEGNLSWLLGCVTHTLFHRIDDRQ